MKMLKKIYISALALVLIAGCKKAPVNVGPPNQYSTATYPATVTDLQTILVSCYANLRDPGLFGFHWLPKALSNSMHTVNSLYNGDQGWNEMSANNLTVGNQYASETWAACYTGIKNCNVTIYAAGVLQKTDPSVSQSDINLILGQAYCLRGWYYMQLECLYGQDYMKAGGTNGDEMGVPLYTQVPANLAETQVPRSTVKATWALIISDEQQAASLLKGHIWAAADEARATQWSAEGLLGKAYIYTQDWADAKTILQDVIQNSGKSLMPYATYHDAFNGDNKFNSESLLELYVDPNSMGGYGIYSGAANSATINGLIWSPFTFGGYYSPTQPYNGTENQIQPLGYGNEFFHDRNVVRYGYNLPSGYTLVANPKYNAAVGPTFYNPQQIWTPSAASQALAARTNGTVDPRLYVNALQPYIDSVQFDGSTWAKVAEPGQFTGDASVYGWGVRKYSPIHYNEGSGQGNPSGSVADAWDYYLLRLADVYLLYAEACINTGDQTDGVEYLNKVKRRAYGYPINSPSVVDYKSTTDQTPAANANDPVLGHNPLYYERWAELFNEGTWWYDVCRWKIGDSEAAFYGSAVNTTQPLTTTFVDTKSYTWPIPLSEINTNSKVVQNPGYK